MNNEKPEFKVCVDTQTLQKILKESKVGETVPYIRLSEAINRDVTGKDRYILDSARRILMREDQIVFEPVRGVGMQRLSDSDITQTSSKFIKAAKKKATKGLRTLACADYGSLSDQERQDYNVGSAILGVMKIAGSSSSVGKVTSLVLSRNEPPNIEEVAKLFAK